MDKENLFRPKVTLDEDVQRELDAALGDMSLQDIIDADDGAASSPASPSRRPGSGLRKGRIVSIQGDDIFVDVGGRSEGLLPANQFPEDEPLPKEGDEIEVLIEGYDDGILRLNRQGAIRAVTWDTLEKGQLVEARVTGHNKGGLEVTFGGVKAFMPISQIDLIRVEDLSPYVGEKFPCVVTDIDYSRQSVVVSRKHWLKQQAKKQAEALWETIHEGKIVAGRVRSLMPYGAFVDLGGTDGLLHVKDMAHGRVEKPEDIVQVGQEIEVRVLSFDRESKKIGLGLKQTQPDPWEGAEGKWPVATSVSGRITRLMDFGAFIEIESGVEGLIPISEMSFRRIGHPKEIVKVGDVVRVQVLSVDSQAKRIGLSLKQAGDDPWQGASVRWSPGSVVEGVVKRIAEFGAFVELADGVEGLVHISELDHKHVASVNAVVSQGQAVQVKVLEVDEERRRIGLSIKQAKEAPAGMGVPAEGTFADLHAVQAQSDKKRKKPLKGGLDAGSIKTPFGELRLG
ncbi:MAG: S1 RNA-binding domain-containing protein [Phycisphaerae bacterium]|nr:S1 RNA-binding domain-containing protein [Phycisphaerae bacterium]